MHATYEKWSITAGTGDIYVALSHSMGAVWGDHTRVTYVAHGERRFPTLAYKNGTEFTKGYDVAWTDPNWHFEYRVRMLGTSRFNPVLTAVAAPAARRVQLVAWPNPFQERISFSTASDLGIRSLQIYDISGRHVRDLLADGTGLGWIWDGRDQAGRPVAQGVYLVRPGGKHAEGSRILLLR
jgi:hypothetical protein